MDSKGISWSISGKIGCLPGEYDIELEEGVSPVQNCPRKIPHVMKAAVEEKLKSLEEYGVIARVDNCSACFSSCNDVIWILCTSRGNSKFWQIHCQEPVESSPKEVAAKEEVFNLTFKEALNSELNVIEEREFIPISDQRWIAVKEATKGDEELKLLQKAITYGWPDRVNLVAEVVQKYWNFRDLLTIQDGVVYKGCRVVVPSC